MAFCPNCGSQTTGTFCSNCGTSLGSAANPPGYAASSQGLSDHVAAALCYTPFLIGLIIDVVMLLVAPYNRNRNIRFHAFQSLFLHGVLFVFWLIVPLVLGVFAVATHGVGFLGFGFTPLLSLAILILFLYLMYQAYNNRKIKLPVIGDLAEKQA